MKKLLTILALISISFSIKAQVCQADFILTVDDSLLTYIDTSTTQNGSIVSWLWDFGDGTTSSQQSGTHQYDLPGPYLVSLTISTDESCTNTTYDSLYIYGAPNPCDDFGMTSNITNSTLSGNDGSISLSVYGGFPPYAYYWDNGLPSSPTVSNLAPGTYCVTVLGSGTGADTCVLTNCFTINEIDTTPGICDGFGMTYNITNVSPGSTDGAISLSVYGGVPPYSYYWNNGLPSTSTVSNLDAGTYCVTIMSSDSSGVDTCILTNCFTVYYKDTMPNPNTCNDFGMTSNITNVLNPEINDGAISLSVYGGTPPYSFYWDNGLPSTPTVSNLAAGTYCVTIEDLDSCVITNCFTVYHQDTMYYPCQIYMTGNTVNESSAGANDGSIDVNIVGGTQPYSYYWSNGQTTEDINNLSTGTYSLYIVDNDSCSLTSIFYVDVYSEEPLHWGVDTVFSEVIDTSFSFLYDSVFVSCYNWVDENTISVTWIIAGTNNVAYLTTEYEIFSSGYNYVLLAINGNKKSIEYYVDLVYFDTSLRYSNDIIEEGISFNIYPNPVKNILNISISILESKNTQLEILNSTGQLVLQQNIDLINGENNINLDLSRFESGIYILKIDNLTQLLIK